MTLKSEPLPPDKHDDTAMILGNEDLRKEIEFQLSLLRLMTEPHHGQTGIKPSARESARLEELAVLVPEGIAAR